LPLGSSSFKVDDDSDVLRAIKRDLCWQHEADHGVLASDSLQSALDLLKQHLAIST
jgi:hypothetical protein